jgi:hypothetical protein
LRRFRKEKNIKERNSIEIDYFYSLEEHRNVERKKLYGMRPTKKKRSLLGRRDLGFKGCIF